VKIGFLQFAPILGDRDANIEKIDPLLKTDAEFDLLVLPELCHSGYNFTSREQARETSEEIGRSVFVEYLESVARQRRCHLVAGVNERDGEQLYNTSVLVGPEGFIGKYRKMHLFWNEPDIFQAGDLGLPVYDIGSCRVGMLICFDWIFPEVWRILALKGADLICHPSNLVLPGFCQKAIPVHAMINRFYVVTANRVGTESELTFTGLSVIADPKGEVIAQAEQTSEEIKTAEMDLELARDKMMTPRNHVFKDRRSEEYRLLCTPPPPS
jgi:predicted amidohydrolase